MARQVPFWEAAVGPAQRELVADEVDEVGGVAAVQDGEAGIEADRVGIVAQEARADAVEGAGPFQSAGEGGVGSQRLGADPLGAAHHRLGSAPGEGQQQQPSGVGTLEDEMGDTVGERGGLARPGPGDDQQAGGQERPGLGQAMQHGRALRRVEFVEVGFGRHGPSDSDRGGGCEGDRAFATSSGDD